MIKFPTVNVAAGHTLSGYFFNREYEKPYKVILKNLVLKKLTIMPGFMKSVLTHVLLNAGLALTQG